MEFKNEVNWKGRRASVWRFHTKIDRTVPSRLAILVAGIYIMTFGVALCIRSDLGSSPISVMPLAWSLAGGVYVGSFRVPNWTMGEYTIIMNSLFVLLQIVLLRKRFPLIQFFQLGMGFFFGFFLDLNMALTVHLQWTSLFVCIIQMLVGGFIMAFGISLEVITRMVMMPGEGITLAIARVTHADFGKIKIFVDCSITLLGAISILVFFGSWQWQIIGIGTLVSMVYVGMVVRLQRPLSSRIEHKIYGVAPETTIASVTTTNKNGGNVGQDTSTTSKRTASLDNVHNPVL